MNVADSQQVASALEHLGYVMTAHPDEADVIVLNTCVVRQSAEDKATGRLMSLRPLKERNPQLVINLMGCLVGIKDNPQLKKRFPFVDVFSPPSDPQPLLAFLTQQADRSTEEELTAQRFAWMDEEIQLPTHQKGRTVSAFVPVVLGCSHACTYCIIPYRRGVEVSRPPEQILSQVRSLAAQGVREITLLGQIVDRYGRDESSYPTLAALMRQIAEVEGIQRIRFLTSHPNWMTEELMDCVANEPKVMPHIEVPIQAGDDTVLQNMRRGYTNADYRRLVAELRRRIPGVSIATDIIVGFPGETGEQFEQTRQLLADLKLDVAHLARYSPREGTVSARRMEDDVPPAEKMRRFRVLEELQEGIVSEIHASHLGKTVEVLFETKVKNRWRGRTPTNKLVFVETDENLRGQIRRVKITITGPWSMIGVLDD